MVKSNISKYLRDTNFNAKKNLSINFVEGFKVAFGGLLHLQRCRSLITIPGLILTLTK